MGYVTQDELTAALEDQAKFIGGEWRKLQERIKAVALSTKKDRPEGRSLLPGSGGGLEVDATARIDQVEVVEALGDVSQLAEALAI